MVVNFKVFKKSAPNGKVTLYMGKRDFVDHVTSVEPVEGVVVLDDEYIRDRRKVWGQLVCSFRYGREEDEVMGLNFQKELYLASEQIYPPSKEADKNSKMQERLMKKLGGNAYAFSFNMPQTAPASITLQQDQKETGGERMISISINVNSNIDLQSNRTMWCAILRKDFYW
jgi:arrestin-1